MLSVALEYFLDVFQLLLAHALQPKVFRVALEEHRDLLSFHEVRNQTPTTRPACLIRPSRRPSPPSPIVDGLHLPLFVTMFSSLNIDKEWHLLEAWDFLVGIRGAIGERLESLVKSVEDENCVTTMTRRGKRC